MFLSRCNQFRIILSCDALSSGYLVKPIGIAVLGSIQGKHSGIAPCVFRGEFQNSAGQR
jgi:hypothetical protein